MRGNLFAIVGLAAGLGVASPAWAMTSVNPSHVHNLNVTMLGSISDGTFTTNVHSAGVSIETSGGDLTGEYILGATAVGPAGSHAHTGVPATMEGFGDYGTFSGTLHNVTLSGYFYDGVISDTLPTADTLAASEPIGALAVGLGLVASLFVRRRSDTPRGGRKTARPPSSVV